MEVVGDIRADALHYPLGDVVRVLENVEPGLLVADGEELDVKRVRGDWMPVDEVVLVLDIDAKLGA